MSTLDKVIDEHISIIEKDEDKYSEKVYLLKIKNSCKTFSVKDSYKMLFQCLFFWKRSYREAVKETRIMSEGYAKRLKKSSKQISSLKKEIESLHRDIDELSKL